MPLPWSMPAGSSGSFADVVGGRWIPGCRRALIACTLPLLLPAPAAAMVYSCADASGRVVLRDVPCKRQETVQNGVMGESVWEPKRKHSTLRGPESPRPVTREQVVQFIDSLDQLFAQRDAAAVLSFFAPDAAFELQYRVSQGIYAVSFDKPRYAEVLRELLIPGAPYTHQRENMRVVLSPDQTQAEVISTLHETVLLDGRRMQAITRSRVTIEWRGSRLQIILVRGPTGFDLDR